MEAFAISDIIASQQEVNHRYHEFLRHGSLSMGLYVIPADATDRQQPHNEDEVYYVVSGQASITVGEDVQDVEPGSIIYVPAQARHQFHDIQDELQLLVFFAPPETKTNA